jgi:hypothetical protein
MSSPDEPHLGDTLPTSRTGRIDPEVGQTQGGTASHERPSFSDPIVDSTSDRSAAPDRVPGAASTTPDRPHHLKNEQLVDQGGFKARAETGNRGNAEAAPMRGAGTPVRREGE